MIAQARRAASDSGRCVRERLGALDVNHPLALGLVARAGHYQANHATRRPTCCSRSAFVSTTALELVDPRYSFTIPPTRLIHVDIDPEEIGRNYPVRSD